MKHIYQLSYWKSGSGHWFCNDIKNLNSKSAKWYAIMRVLNLNIEEYLDLLNKYHAQHIYYYEPTDYLSFYFLYEKDVKAFCSYVNKIAKQKQFYCN